MSRERVSAEFNPVTANFLRGNDQESSMTLSQRMVDWLDAPINPNCPGNDVLDHCMSRKK